MLDTATFHLETMHEAAEDGYATATEIADWLVRYADIPFREAHHTAGRIVRLAEERGCKLSELDLQALQLIDRRITDDLYRTLSAKNAVASRSATQEKIVRIK